MYRRSLFRAIIAVAALPALLFAQPLTIRDIQYNPGTPGGASPYSGQHVRVAGIVTMNQFNVGAGGGRSFFVQDRDTTTFHGLFVRSNLATAIAVGDSVQVTGTIDESSGETMLRAASNDTLTNFATNVWTPAPTAATIAELANTTNGEPYEGMLVRITAAKVADIIPAIGIRITNNAGDTISVNGLGRWNRTYAIGDSIRYLVGLVRQTGTTFTLEPRGDVDFTSYTNDPPIVSAIRHTPGDPGIQDTVTFWARAFDVETTVSNVWLLLTINNGTPDSITMIADTANWYHATHMPFARGTNVRYSVRARDSQGAISAETPGIPFTVTRVSMQFIVANIDTFMNRNVSVSGIIAYALPRKTTSSTRTDAYIIDPATNYGMYISEGLPPSSLPSYARGNLVTLSGTITQYQGAIELINTMATTSTPSVLPAPTQVRTGDQAMQRTFTQSGNYNYFNSGAWMEVTGRVVAVDINVGGGTNMLIDDGSGTLAIRMVDTANVKTVRTARGDSIQLTDMTGRVFTIRGVASSYSGDFQMLAGYREDFIERDSTLYVSTSTIVDVPARVLVNDWGEKIKITYGAPPLARVQLRVFNMKGQMVATLIDKTSTGVAEYEWDGRDELREKLPPGTYILHVMSNYKGDTKSATAPIVIGTKL